MNEKEVIEKLIAWVKEQHQDRWKVQTEIPVSDMSGQLHRADARIIEVDDVGLVRRVIAYAEAKGDDIDAKELQVGYAQCLLYADLTGSESWYVLPHAQVTRFLTPDRAGKIDGRVKVVDVEKAELIDPLSVVEKMGKSRMKRKQESPLFSGWSSDYEIEITTPLAITTPELDPQGNVIFNTGTRIRGSLKELAKTISPGLSESIKYSLYVSPETTAIGKKDELTLKQKFVPDKRRGGSLKHEYYELPPPRRLPFTIHCMNPKLTEPIVEEMIRRAGIFAGVGDSHSDGTHGRYRLTTTEPTLQ